MGYIGEWIVISFILYYFFIWESNEWKLENLFLLEISKSDRKIIVNLDIWGFRGVILEV